MKTRKRFPMLGSAFDSHQRDERENVQAYIDELQYYGKRRFAKLIQDGEMMLGNPDYRADCTNDWQNDCDSALSQWAQERTRCDYYQFGPFPNSGDIGFYVDVDSALSDADLRIDDLSELPRGFSGLAVQVNDHGNVTAWQVSNGRKRELFAVV
jgi:hypothetical protein